MTTHNPQHDLGKLILRVVLGVLILLHGIGKIRGRRRSDQAVAGGAWTAGIPCLSS